MRPRRHIWFSLATLLFSLSAFAQVSIPKTRAGETFSAWINSFNSGDIEQIRAFRAKYKRMSDIDEVLSWREATGGFELLRIEDSKPDSLIAMLKERASDRAARFTLTARDDGVGENLVMSARPVSLPPEFAIPRLSMQDALAALAARAEEQTRQDRFAGVVLVARNGEILFERAYGYADRESRTPVTLDTQFRMGSMNKMFTAVATLQLVEAGKLALDGVVGQYLPFYPNRQVATKVSVRHLLTHTGGTGDIFGSEFEKHRLELKEHADYLKLFATRAPEFEPGAEDRYSNYGYVLLGALIEQASGMSYYDYVRTRIFEPAGMRSIGSLPESERVPSRAHGYTRTKGQWTSNADSLPYRGMAAGGGYSTAGDMQRFAQALQSGRLISNAMLAHAVQPQDLGKAYGYGFGIQDEGALRFFGHGGGAPGMNGELRIFPELGYVLIALSNLDPPAADHMVEHFAVRMPVEDASLHRAGGVQ